MRFELHYSYATPSLRTKISPTRTCRRATSPRGSCPSTLVLPGANRPSRIRVRNRVRRVIHTLAFGLLPGSGRLRAAVASSQIQPPPVPCLPYLPPRFSLSSLVSLLLQSS